MTADPKAILRGWEDRQALRMPHEGRWQQVCDYFAPAKSFTLGARPGELTRRRVTSSIGPRVVSRGAALLVAYLIDATNPFIGPNVEAGLIRQGRTLDLDSAAHDYLDNIEWQVHGNMVRPASSYISSTSQAAVELYLFGGAVRASLRKRGFGPKYVHRPLRSCWFEENEDGDVDTLDFRFTLPAYRALTRYPELKKNAKLLKLAADDKTCQTPVTLLHSTQPREYGRMGAVATAKPFQSVIMAVDEKTVAEESGFDSFPYSVPRLGREEGSCYGTGLAWYALPNVMVINALQQGVEVAVALRNNPPLMKPARLFPKPFDRRPGAMNNYDPVGLGFSNLKDAVQKLDLAGDAAIGADYMTRLEREVEEIFFIDWMSLNDGVQKTAEEIRDRRDLRVRALSALVPSVDRDLIGKDADRTLEIMIEEGMVPAPPSQLSRVDVSWDYKGPLAMMQKRGQVETIDRLFDLAIKGKTIDDTSGQAIIVDECLRTAADAVGLQTNHLRSRQAMEAGRQAANEQQQDRADMEQTMGAATALRDAGQGLASLEGGLGGGRPKAAA